MSDGCWDSTGGGLWNGGKQKPAQTTKPSPSTPVEKAPLTTRQWLESWFIRNNPAKWMLATEYDRVSIMCSCLDDFLAASRSTPTAQPDPYPFHEVIDSGESVKFDMDGDKWCATRVSFVNLQESLAGFGDTPMQALVELIKAEVAPTPAVERDYEKLSDELCRMLGFECDDSAGCVECPIHRKEVAEWLRTHDQR